MEEVEWHCRYYDCGNVIKKDEEYCRTCLERSRQEDVTFKREMLNNPFIRDSRHCFINSDELSS